MKVFITKYALTTGIYEAEARRVEGHADMLEIPAAPGAMSQYIHGLDWHITHESALMKAEAMRRKKIASLRKQLSELEEMKFE